MIFAAFGTAFAPAVEQILSCHSDAGLWRNAHDRQDADETNLDRFLHHSEIFTVTGKSYRLRDRGAGSTPAKAPTGSATENQDKKSSDE